jgi:hypothetical protein
MTSCAKNLSIVVAPGCDCTTDWTNPGSCRILISDYVDNVLTPCFGATLSALPGWDGTLSIFSSPQYLADTTGVSISGRLFIGANLFQVGGHWSLSITGDTGGAPNAMWNGQLVSACPIGVYTRTGGCQPGPATFTLAGYSL